MMQIVPFEKEHVPDVTRLVNKQIASVPPYWQLSEAQVWDILQKPSLWEIHYEDEERPTKQKWNVETICVVEDERVLAAVRFDHTYNDEKFGGALARWLVSEPQYPVARDMLLDTLIARRGNTDAAIEVDGRTDFGIGWSGIPTTDLYLNAALEAKGFVANQKWLIMTSDIQSFAGSAVPIKFDQFHLSWAINESLLEWDLNLYQRSIYDEEYLIGECQSWGIPPEFAACDGYNDWMQIEWLGVVESDRGRGFGRRLLTEQLRYHAARGKRYCLLYTETDNTSAIKLYTRMGFTIQAEVWGWLWPHKV